MLSCNFRDEGTMNIGFGFGGGGGSSERYFGLWGIGFEFYLIVISGVPVLVLTKISLFL
jgi:hypothetical protein